MAIEIEKKYRLDKKRLVELPEKLANLGAMFANDDEEENYLYRGGILDFRNAALRLRKTDGKTIFTYKEKAAGDSGFKHQIEFETVVSDGAATQNIIERLGYKLTAVYEKRRASWHLDNVVVALDELPFGCYVEIEGAIEDILAAEIRLGLEDLEMEVRGYPLLTVEFGEQKDGVFEARFESSREP